MEEQAKVVDRTAAILICSLAREGHHLVPAMRVMEVRFTVLVGLRVQRLGLVMAVVVAVFN